MREVGRQNQVSSAPSSNRPGTFSSNAGYVCLDLTSLRFKTEAWMKGSCNTHKCSTKQGWWVQKQGLLMQSHYIWSQRQCFSLPGSCISRLGAHPDASRSVLGADMSPACPTPTCTERLWQHVHISSTSWQAQWGHLLICERFTPSLRTSTRHLDHVQAKTIPQRLFLISDIA